MLAAFGSDCAALGFVGGHNGDILSEGLKKYGIKTDFVHVKGETRTNVSVVNARNDDYFKINEPGPEISTNEINELLQKVQDLICPDDWWVLAGSLPPGLKSDIYACLIQLINQGGAKAVLDSSGEALKLGCKAGPFLIKPNLEELIQISDEKEIKPKGIAKAIKAVHAFGVKNIIVSAGKEKTIFSNGITQWAGFPPKIQEMNPIGAGDAMLAAVVYRLSENKDISDAFTWGIAAGSAAAGLPGTKMPIRSEVEELIHQVKVSEE